ncbi:NAD(P)-binding protein, partial [Dichomitus squalens LYAD-421 SS1]|uniref:NAD(P)-binding protein n=1 Tax=Dichomitus squalens (strain LYAD-421) TaxID=732165 RepID=UPI0004414072
MSADLFSIANRVMLVTGASSGIGSYVAQGLARAGAARVYITGRRAAQLDSVAQAVPGVLVPLVGDVSTIDGCKALADAFVSAERRLGVQDVKLDLLFNNAGMAVAEGFWGSSASGEQIRDALLQVDDKDWATVFAVNVGSLQWLSAALLPYLIAASGNNGKAEGRGCIINNTSVSAFFVSPQVQGHLYAASKAAAESMSLNLASKFTRLGVRVNSIAPANVPSELNSPDNPRSFISLMKDHIPIGRIGNQDDVVAAVMYLASRAGSYISGNVIKVDVHLLPFRFHLLTG